MQTLRLVQYPLATGPVQCRRCAAEWPTDPALSVSVRRPHADSVARFVVHLATQCQEFMDDG